MEATKPTTEVMPAENTTTVSAQQRRRAIERATTATIAVASLATATAAGPLLAFISYNHNETLVASRAPCDRRPAATTAGAVAAGLATVAMGTAVLATPVLAFITYNHNETLVSAARV